MKKSGLRMITVVLALLGVLGMVVPAVAQDIVTPTAPPIVDGPVWNFDGLKIAYQRVDVAIEDQIATTHIDQLFVNDNEWILEGTYLFPLPAGAAVSQLTMWVDGQAIEAKILPQDEARQIYDEIVRQLRDPALLEYVGHDAIQANVFPIPPHEERRIEIEYSQVLPADNGLVHYTYPQATSLYSNTPLDEQRIGVDIRSSVPIRTVYSPSHPVAIERESDFRARASYEASAVSEIELAGKDFELFYSLTPTEIGLNLLSYREAGEDGFFLLLAAPSVEAAAGDVVEKDIILVLDTSGSMEGEKLVQAKAAAAYVIEHLNAGDRFNIVSFSSGVRSLAPALLAAGASAGQAQFVDGLEALGGTNISMALLEAARMVDPERPTTLIFLTDGLATEGIEETGLLLDNVAQAMPANARLFAFGVGNDVDTTLLGSLAQNHRGATTYVRPFESIDEVVSGFYAKVSMPVLSDISLDFGDIAVEQIYPQQLPDLFAGSQLVLAGRYRQGGPATITLRGQVNGREQIFTYPDNNFAPAGGEAFIPRLWATRAIGHLLTEIRLHGDDEELVQSVVNLSLRYGIITPYTSYLIEEDDIFSQTARQGMVEDAVGQRAAASQAVSGEIVVEEAAVEAEMMDAAAPLVMSTATYQTQGGEGGVTAAEVVRLVGSKTFVLRDGAWIDTTFDPGRHEVQSVDFASDDYFDLLSAAPGLGQYFALGQQVLVVLGDEAYQIVTGTAGDTPAAAIVAAGATAGNQPADPTAEIVAEAAASAAAPVETGAETAGGGVCAAPLALPLLLGLVAVAATRRRE